MEKILVYFAIKYEGDWDKIYQAINKKEKVDVKEMEEVVSSLDCEYITLINEKYPSRLKHIYKPPFVLFYKGNIDLINSPKKTIGVVGSRKCSKYGCFVTEKLVKELTKENVIIVSGLASGVDSIAHSSCLLGSGDTIAVLGNGVNIFYPSENQELQEEIANKGLLVSEYPPGISAEKENFPKRNRIIAGLSDGILVSEAKYRSGSMITVTRGLELGKEIFCVPDCICNESGCNKLIKEGAKLVECANDILIEL